MQIKLRMLPNNFPPYQTVYYSFRLNILMCTRYFGLKIVFAMEPFPPFPNKLILKGIIVLQNARHAVEPGAAALVVSNRGGRQLDGAPSSIAELANIVDSVSGGIVIDMDSGIRSGHDVIKALALGAPGVYSGRRFHYGLGAGIKAVVTRCLEIIRKKLGITMAFCGHRDGRDVDERILWHPATARATTIAGELPGKTAFPRPLR